MRAVLVANFDDVEPGFVGRALRRRGYSFVEFLREQHDLWPSLEGVALVVSLGSSWSTYWEDVREPVLAEQRLMADAVARGVPVLGICFGAQQLATVLGGEVSRAPAAEIGWHPVRPIAESADEVPACLATGPWMQWHYDRFSAPPGATVLADSPVGPQAIRAGKCLGVQFHPEANETIVSLWSRGGGAEELATVGITPEALLRDTRAHQDDAESRCGALIDWFLSEVAQPHMPS